MTAAALLGFAVRLTGLAALNEARRRGPGLADGAGNYPRTPPGPDGLGYGGAVEGE